MKLRSVRGRRWVVSGASQSGTSSSHSVSTFHQSVASRCLGCLWLEPELRWLERETLRFQAMLLWLEADATWFERGLRLLERTPLWLTKRGVWLESEALSLLAEWL